MALGGSSASLPPVQLEQFDGPLDLLLDEVRRQHVAIEKIGMAPIVARFLEYVRTAAERNLNLDIEWLHMAATLIHWKSRSLLPADAGGQGGQGDQQDGIRDDLVRQLLAHQKDAARELGRRQSAERTQFSRVDPEFREEEAATAGAGESSFVSVWEMIQLARELGRWAGEHREDQRHGREAAFGVGLDDVTVAEMIEYLRAQLAAAPGLKLDGLRLLGDQPSAPRRSCLFLGMLEMACDGQLEMEQNESFGPILLSDRLTAKGGLAATNHSGDDSDGRASASVLPTVSKRHPLRNPAGDL